jgi:large subunit ribosomal protein L14e
LSKVTLKKEQENEGEKMAVFDVGRVCVKIAGRDANKKCVVVEVIDSRYVTIDGETRRRKCNTGHLEPLDVVVELSSGADNAAVVKAMKAEGFVCKEKVASEKQEEPRPKKVKKVKVKKAKTAKKETPKVEKKPEAKVEKKVEPKAKPEVKEAAKEPETKVAEKTEAK